MWKISVREYMVVFGCVCLTPVECVQGGPTLYTTQGTYIVFEGWESFQKARHYLAGLDSRRTDGRRGAEAHNWRLSLLMRRSAHAQNKVQTHEQH